jgi:Adenylate and Guanylate cyclase catalytic domain
MDFFAVVDQVIELLQSRGRVSYRALKRQFTLDDAYLDDLKVEIIEVQQLAVDQDGTMLVWTGEPGAASPVAPPPARAPLTYTPPYLTEKILTTKTGLEGERKQVTVLFADLKDSTELIRGLDPEAAQQLLDPAIHHMMDAVHRFEGTVNQVLGDGIMALFGAPIAHEDHALRACYAALAMQAAMRAYTADVRHTGAWSCACAWASTPGKSWCGPLGTTCTWTTRRSGRPPIWQRAWSSSPHRGPSALALPLCA